MLIEDFCERVTTRFDYPVEVDELLDEFGDILIDSASVDDQRRVDELLGHLDDVSFVTPRDLSELLYGHLTEEYIGRKYYDDRGPNNAIKSNEPIDIEHSSI